MCGWVGGWVGSWVDRWANVCLCVYLNACLFGGGRVG